MNNKVFQGMKPLKGNNADGLNETSVIDTMCQECIGAKLIKLHQGGWGLCDFSRMEFDNGYVVINNNNHHEIYDNKHIMHFELYRIIRDDDNAFYFIDKKNAEKFLKLYKLSEADEDFKVFTHAKVEKCSLSMTAYELSSINILDNHFQEAEEDWVSYLNTTRTETDLYSHYIDY